LTGRFLAGLAAAATLGAQLPAPVVASANSGAAQGARATPDDGSGARRVAPLARTFLRQATSSVAVSQCDDTFGLASSPSPGTSSNGLNAVSGVSANDSWAVGASQATGGLFQTLTEHWDGNQWSIVPSANNAGQDVLLGVAAVSSNDVWAVGLWQATSTAVRQPLIEHWDGSIWTITPIASVGAGDNALESVSANSATDVWAVGYSRSTNTAARTPLTWHWDGVTWTNFSAPTQGTGSNVFYGVASAPGAVWAVGYWNTDDTSTGVSHPLLELWNGTAWIAGSAPLQGTGHTVLFAVAAVSATEFWAVGFQEATVGAVLQNLTYHLVGPVGFTGPWLYVPSPNPSATVDNFFNGVGATSSGDVWAVGEYGSNTTVFQSQAVQWNGTKWTAVPTANPGGTTELLGAWTIAGTNVLAVGDYFNGSTYQTLVEQLCNPTVPFPPIDLHTLAGHGEATVIWTPQQGTGRQITGWTVSAFPVGSPGTGPTIQLPANATSATINGLTDGVAYSVDVEATNSLGSSGTTLAGPVSPTAVPLGTAVVVLPVVAHDAYGGYTTVAQIENTSSTPANVTVKYFDANGNQVGAGDSVASLAANASWLLRNDNPGALPAASAGSAVIYSDQPVAAFVNEFAPGGGDATSYTGVRLTTATGTLYAPAIVNNAYGGYTTGIGLVNLGHYPTAVSVTYRDGSGTLITTQNLGSIAAGAYQGLYSGDPTLALPNGFAGTATITSSAGNLAAVVNETGPGGQFSSYDALPAGSTTLFAPVALNNAFGGYNTGMAIQNTTTSAGTVTINYYDATGATTTKAFPVGANGYLGIYQGSATDGPAPGAYTASITSTVAIAVIVNEVAPSTTAAQQSTSYNTFAAGGSTLHLPLVESAGPDAWSTGEGIMNTGTAATTITVTYYDVSTGAQAGTPQSLIVQPNAFWGLYQPAGGLPNGTRATAVVTSGAGGQVAVICNESNESMFMSYIGI